MNARRDSRNRRTANPPVPPSAKKEGGFGALGVLAFLGGAAAAAVGGKLLFDRFRKPAGTPSSTRPSGNNKRPTPPKPWSKGPGGKGKVFGGGNAKPGEGPPLPEDLPEEFDYGGNGIYIDPDFRYVIEGNRFWPSDEFAINAIEYPTLEEVLAEDDNSVVGLIDYLMNEGGIDQPEGIAWAVLEHAHRMSNPEAMIGPVALEETEYWGDGLINWYDNFLERVVAYVDEGSIGLDEPEDVA